MNTIFDITEKTFVNKRASKEMADNKQCAEISLNLAIVGGKSVGKSALTVRFLTKKFIGEYDSQADLCIDRHISITDKDVNLHLKDTTGSDWVKGPSALIGWSTCIAVVYSITDRRSYDLVKLIFEKLKLSERVDSSCVLLLGNKNDLEYLREVTFSEGENLASTYGTKFYETSAATDYVGVYRAFRNLICEATHMQTSKSPNGRDDGLPKRPIYLRRDSPIHRSNRYLIKSPSIESRSSLAGSTSSTVSSSASDDELCDLKPNTTVPFDEKLESKSQVSLVGKKRRISLPTFITRTVHTQKYFNFNKTR